MSGAKNSVTLSIWMPAGQGLFKKRPVAFVFRNESSCHYLLIKTITGRTKYPAAFLFAFSQQRTQDAPNDLPSDG